VAAADGPVRLDTVVYRRDRFFETIAVGLFTALAVVLLWPLVPVFFWGLFGMPWVALIIALACTAAVIRWGARLGRGSLRRARRAPYLVITADEMLAGHAAGSSLARIPLDAIRVVAIDEPPAGMGIAGCGQGSVQTALASGLPFIGVPLQPEQDANVFFAQRQGAARLLTPKAAGSARLAKAAQLVAWSAASAVHCLPCRACLV